MPSSNPPRVPKYRLHKTTGLAKVRLSGRDVYLGEYGTPESRTKYRKVVAEWLASARQEPIGPRSPDKKTPLTINELVLAYLDFAKVYYVRAGVPTGEVQNLKYAVTPLVELYGATNVDQFGPVALKAVRQVMIDRDWCRSLVNGRINRIRRVFKWGVENELVPSSVLHGLQAVSGLKLGRCSVRETEPVKPVPDAIVAATCEVAPRVVASMIQLQRLSGMRPGEVVIMRTKDIDTSGRIWRYVPGHHKTEHHGRSRVVYLGPAAQRLLKPLLKSDLDAFIFTPADALAELALVKRSRRKTPVQPSQVLRQRRAKGRRLRGGYTTTTYARAISYACDRAFPHPELSRIRASRLNHDQLKELDAWQKAHRWSPNRLRHSAATQLRKEFGIEAARVVLGHSSAGVTEIYAEQDLARAAEIMGRVG
ncbi:MAG: tyrosine-type recombinase/integrase [Phycisphaerales bacterium]